MRNPDLMYLSQQDARTFSPEPQLERRILANNPRLMIVEHRMSLGWAGARNSHPHDQAVYVISGHLRFLCGDEAFEAHAGDSFVVRGGVEHQAWALTAAHVIDIFTPTREDYLEKP